MKRLIICNILLTILILCGCKSNLPSATLTLEIPVPSVHTPTRAVTTSPTQSDDDLADCVFNAESISSDQAHKAVICWGRGRQLIVITSQDNPRIILDSDDFFQPEDLIYEHSIFPRVWSRDGNQLFFTAGFSHDGDGLCSYGDGPQAVYSIDVRNGEIQPVLPNKAREEGWWPSVSFSPTGENMVYALDGQMVIRNLETQTEQIVSMPERTSFGQYYWSKDGLSVFFSNCTISTDYLSVERSWITQYSLNTGKSVFLLTDNDLAVHLNGWDGGDILWIDREDTEKWVHEYSFYNLKTGVRVTETPFIIPATETPSIIPVTDTPTKAATTRTPTNTPDVKSTPTLYPTASSGFEAVDPCFERENYTESEFADFCGIDRGILFSGDSSWGAFPLHRPGYSGLQISTRTETRWTLSSSDFLAAEDIERDSYLWPLAWTPDNRYFYFTSNISRDGFGDCLFDLGSQGVYRLDTTTGKIEPIRPLLSSADGSYYDVSISPNGRYLIYDTEKAITFTDLSTGKSTETTVGEFTSAGGFEWSSDGKSLTYTQCTYSEEGTFIESEVVPYPFPGH
jgi:hypothetical protein